MFKEALAQYMPEIKIIEARTNSIINKHADFVLFAKQILKERQSHQWLSLLCIISAKINNCSINKRVMSMAEIMLLLEYALHIHWEIADSIENANMKKDIQYPVLFGDYLYSQLYMEICQNELEEYVKDISSLLEIIHNEKLLIKCNEICYDEKILNIYGLLGETAFYLGAHITRPEAQNIMDMKRMGYNLGLLYAIEECKVGNQIYSSILREAWNNIACIPESQGKDMIVNMLIRMNEKWKTNFNFNMSDIKECYE